MLTVVASEWAGPFSPFVNATSSGTAAVTVYRSPGAAVSQLWAIWNSTQTDNNGTTGLTYGVGQDSTAGMTWSTGQPVIDTLGNRVQSAFTPSLAVLGNQMHLIVVKPDGRGTLAHYIYIDSLRVWEYNTGWVVQPQTTASPSVTSFSTSGLLYLAFTTGGSVSVCTYTPGTLSQPKHGVWSTPVATGVASAVDAPAFFTVPRQAGPELHFAVTASNNSIKEYTMGNSVTQWSLTTQQPSGLTKRGMGAASTSTEVILTVSGAGAIPTLYHTIWTEDAGWFSKWASGPGLVLSYGNAAPAVYEGLVYCFYVVSVDSEYRLVYVTSTLR